MSDEDERLHIGLRPQMDPPIIPQYVPRVDIDEEDEQADDPTVETISTTIVDTSYPFVFIDLSDN